MGVGRGVESKEGMGGGGGGCIAEMGEQRVRDKSESVE